MNHFRPQSSLVLTPLGTTTTKRPPSVLLPVQTISRPPNNVNPLLSGIANINEVSGNVVDEKQCGQQELSSGMSNSKLNAVFFDKMPLKKLIL